MAMNHYLIYDIMSGRPKNVLVRHQLVGLLVWVDRFSSLYMELPACFKVLIAMKMNNSQHLKCTCSSGLMLEVALGVSVYTYLITELSPEVASRMARSMSNWAGGRVLRWNSHSGRQAGQPWINALSYLGMYKNLSKIFCQRKPLRILKAPQIHVETSVVGNSFSLHYIQTIHNLGNCKVVAASMQM